MSTVAPKSKRFPLPLLIISIVLVLALLASLGSWLASKPNSMPVAKPPVVAALETLELPGWTRELLPLGDTELVRQKVLETLNFDYATFVRFRRGGREFAVYIAYWAPNKATARDVRLHTPDTCWVQAGWTEQSRDETYIAIAGAVKSDFGQYRCYTQSGFKQHVIFWHFMNGQLVPHWRYGQPTVTQILRAMFGKPEAVRGEQYFVRVSSPETLDDLLKDVAGVELLKLLAPIGLTSAHPPQ